MFFGGSGSATLTYRSGGDHRVIVLRATASLASDLDGLATWDSALEVPILESGCLSEFALAEDHVSEVLRMMRKVVTEPCAGG